MHAPDIFQFFDFRAYMMAHAAWKKATTPNWSLGVWANRLGASGTASISRILSGDRIPGEEMTEALVKNLGLGEAEKAYFRRLIARERYYKSESFGAEPLFVMKNAWNLDLLGSVDKAKTTEFLRPYGLEPISVGEIIVASFNINTYQETSIGALSENQLCITARPLNGGMLDSGLFMVGIQYDRKDFADEQRNAYGVLVEYSKIQVEKRENHWLGFVGNATRPLFDVAVGDRHTTRIDERYEMYAYMPKIDAGMVKVKFTIDTLGREFVYRAETDGFNPDPNNSAHQTLARLDFRPLKWIIHENLFSLIYPPTPLGQLSSY